MFANRIEKTFTTRRNLLRGGFPAAHEFLIELEERSPPVIWLVGGKEAQVYWQDSFLCGIHFVGVGEVNTGIRVSAQGGKLAEGTVDRSALLFPQAVHDLVERHGGLRNRWATAREGGEIELRHPAPGAFFRDLMALLQTSGARDRAERMTDELTREIAESDHAAAASATTPAMTPATTPATATTWPATESAPAAAARAQAGTTGAAAAATHDAAASANATSATAGPSKPVARRQRTEPLRPRDTHRLLSIAHLIDAYVAWTAATGAERERAAARVEALERAFLCRLPRPEELRGHRSADRVQVIELAWRCLELAARIESPFLAPPEVAKAAMIHALWDNWGEALGTPVEALRRTCCETATAALLQLFPGVDEARVSEAELDDGRDGAAGRER